MVKVDVREARKEDGRKEALKKARAASAGKSRTRRSADQLLAIKKAKREALVAKVAKLDADIARMETRYEKSLKLAEFAQKTPEELQAELTQAKELAKLLRKATKVKAGP